MTKTRSERSVSVSFTCRPFELNPCSLFDCRLFKHPLTTPDVKACVEDLKILGKKDFKNLLKWRVAVREDLGLDVKVDEVEDEFIEEAEVEPMDEEEQISQEVSHPGRQMYCPLFSFFFFRANMMLCLFLLAAVSSRWRRRRS